MYRLLERENKREISCVKKGHPKGKEYFASAIFGGQATPKRTCLLWLAFVRAPVLILSLFAEDRQKHQSCVFCNTHKEVWDICQREVVGTLKGDKVSSHRWEDKNVVTENCISHLDLDWKNLFRFCCWRSGREKHPFSVDISNTCREKRMHEPTWFAMER